LRAGFVAAAAAAVTALYFVFRSALFYPDPMRWELMLAAEGPAGAWHPHHLAYTPLAVAAWRVLQLVGYGGRLFGAMRILDAALGGAGFVVFYALLRRARVGFGPALAGAAALAFSYGYWAFACNAECVILLTVAAVAAMWAVTWADAGSSVGRWFAAAVVAGAAAWTHVANAVLVVFVVAAFLSWARGRRRWLAVPLAGAFALPGVLAYGVVGSVLLGKTPGATLRWLLGTPGATEYYTSYHIRNVLLDGYALGRSLVGIRWAKDAATGVWTAGVVVPAVLTVALAAALAAAFAVAVAGARRSAPGGRRWVLWAGAAFLPPAVYFTFRDAGAVDRWTVQLAALLFFIYVGLSRARPGRLARAVTYGIPALLAVTNFAGSIYPESRPANNEHLAVASFLRGYVRPGDVVISSGFGGLGPGPYIEYFAGARTLSIYYGTKDADAFRGALDAAWAGGRAAYVFDDRPRVTSLALVAPGRRDAYAITGAAAARILAPYTWEPVAVYAGPRYAPSRLWRLRPRPAAGDIP